MIINKNEAKAILNKKQSAITRFYPAGCRYQAKGKITLKVETDGKLQDLFFCTVRSIRPVTENDYVTNSNLLATEGFTHVSGWRRNLEKTYNGVAPTQGLYRLTLNIDRINDGSHTKKDKKSSRNTAYGVRGQ